MFILLKPKSKDVPVRKPEGGFLAEKGEEVERTSYWVRRIKDGDVIDVKAEAEQAAKAKATTKAVKAKAVAEQGE
jgi:hypothetical protein